MKRDLFRCTAFAPVYEAAGLTAIDIGSRGGFDRDLLPIAWTVDGIGFEPEPDAFAALSSDCRPWRSVRWLPAAVGAKTGSAVLNVPPDANGASLLPHDPEVGRRFGLEHLTEDTRAIPVETMTLDDAARNWGFKPADYLKLDIEGAELSILQAAPESLAAALAIKTEASFIPARIGQPVVADLDQYLRGQGFMLMDVMDPARWRRRPVAPHPYSWAGEPAFSRGQIAQCDLLFLRDPAPDDGATLLRTGLMAMAMGYFDLALVLFERPAAAEIFRRDWQLEPRPTLAAVSRVWGRHAALWAIGRNLRDLVPLVRSLAGGIPG